MRKFFNVRVHGDSTTRTISYNQLTRALLLDNGEYQATIENAILNLYAELYQDRADITNALSALELIKEDYGTSYASVVETAVARYVK